MGYESYGEIELETSIDGASPHKLIGLLLDRCVYQIQLSKNYMENNNIPKKCQAISKALDIITYLRICLNHENPEAKKLSKHLDEVYGFIDDKLLKANMENSVEYLDQSLRLIDTVRDAWSKIENKKDL